MSFTSFLWEIGNISNKSSRKRHRLRRGQAHINPEASFSSSPGSPGSSTVQIEQRKWANLPPELLLDIIQRVEQREQCWPGRRDVVACASVCRSWREITKDIVKTPELCGFLTFPISLKQPGPRDTPIQCFIRRERATSTFRLYMGLSPGELSKLLLAAKRVRRATGTDFVISLVGDDFSRSSNKYVGKLRSNFLGTKFNIFDSQPSTDSTVCSSCELCRKTHPGKVAPRVTTSNHNTAKISYELNILRTRGPRRMQCIMNSIPVSAIEEGGTAPTPTAFTNCLDEHSSPLLDSAGRRPQVGSTSRSMQNVPLVLKNKAPRWHEQLQCWCLNFKGRVTVASVKNFQLVAAVEPSENVTITEQENVILQFGKIGKDIFTMDYCYPLSAFQAFAICLSSFDTKPVCE
ncbi:hypothetical protein V6Z11_A06G009600 [Gossypium hirsutum]|uniref:Tubby-like F-box protein 5 isoform X3 n=1 Tax=Gossypium hirsutum TaxID=3635 RepID=A0ABM3BUF2_GOSHI|nr:tubby-like F-box protein 5 isoform X3 [Gossypium hirsutum]